MSTDALTKAKEAAAKAQAELAAAEAAEAAKAAERARQREAELDMHARELVDHAPAIRAELDARQAAALKARDEALNVLAITEGVRADVEYHATRRSYGLLSSRAEAAARRIGVDKPGTLRERRDLNASIFGDNSMSPLGRAMDTNAARRAPVIADEVLVAVGLGHLVDEEG